MRIQEGLKSNFKIFKKKYKSLSIGNYNDRYTPEWSQTKCESL